MTCPKWNDLARSRDAAEDDSAWREALEHLDGCDACRPEALAADPTLVFRRLPAPVVTDADVAGMRERVALLRRARDLEAIESGPPRPSRGRLAARVAAVLLVVGSLTTVDFPSPDPVAAPARPRALPAALAAEPVLEDADRPYDQVVEWTHDDLAVVVLVDDSFDV